MAGWRRLRTDIHVNIGKRHRYEDKQAVKLVESTPLSQSEGFPSEVMALVCNRLCAAVSSFG
jgi:hypothetical protein